MVIADEDDDVEVDAGATRTLFSPADVKELLLRYAQLTCAHQKSDHLSESYYSKSSVLGSLAGAVAIIAMACQGMSFEPSAPLLCHVAGPLANACMMLLGIAYGVNGYEDLAKVLQECRSDCGSEAQEILQALYLQPNVNAPILAYKLKIKAQKVVDKWAHHQSLTDVFCVGTEVNRNTPEVQAILEEAESTLRNHSFTPATVAEGI